MLHWRLSTPVLLLLGRKDGLVGDPENTRQLVQNIPDVRIEILDVGHLISAEKPDEFNRLVHEFIENKSGNKNGMRHKPILAQIANLP